MRVVVVLCVRWSPSSCVISSNGMFYLDKFCSLHMIRISVRSDNDNLLGGGRTRFYHTQDRLEFACSMARLESAIALTLEPRISIHTPARTLVISSTLIPA